MNIPPYPTKTTHPYDVATLEVRQCYWWRYIAKCAMTLVNTSLGADGRFSGTDHWNVQRDALCKAISEASK